MIKVCSQFFLFLKNEFVFCLLNYFDFDFRFDLVEHMVLKEQLPSYTNVT